MFHLSVKYSGWSKFHKEMHIKNHRTVEKRMFDCYYYGVANPACNIIQRAYDTHMLVVYVFILRA